MTARMRDNTNQFRYTCSVDRDACSVRLYIGEILTLFSGRVLLVYKHIQRRGRLPGFEFTK